MLNEQPDKALDVFLQMVQVDSDTVETHFALGNLYRRRGEVDRAIRIHQNLIARPNLNKGDKQNALFNLAEDYLKAGLMDRAESLYRQVEGPSDFHEMAQRRVVSLLEQQKDWQQAIELIKKRQLNQETKTQLAHYYCELAEHALLKNDFFNARQNVNSANAMQSDFIRAKILLARIAVNEGKQKEAIKLLNEILVIDASFASELLPDFYKLAQSQEKPEFFDKNLEQLIEEHPSSKDVLVSALVTHNLVETEGAKKLIQDYLHNGKSFAALNETLDQPQHSFATSLQLLRLAGHGKAAYQCMQCGYASSHHQWNCPGCKSWSTARATSLY